MHKIFSKIGAVPSSDDVMAFQSYVAFEIREANPSRVLCVYERAVVACCLSAELWSVVVQ